MPLFTRRILLQLTGATAAATVGLRPYRSFAAENAVTIGIDLSLTGADAETAVRIHDGFTLAIDEANAKGGAAGYHLNVLLLDDGTATAGQYDPAQGATNARRTVALVVWPMFKSPNKDNFSSARPPREPLSLILTRFAIASPMTAPAA